MSQSDKMNRVQKRISRSLSLQIYYAWVMSQTHPKELLDYMKSLLEDKEINDNFYMNGFPIDSEQSILDDNIIKYAYRLIESTINQSDVIDKFISTKLKNWDLNRIALIDKLILRLALTEMFFFDEIPNKVSIVEGVEIAKIYGNNESSAFINGVLDSLYNDLENNKIEI
jgi:transcription antitermination factor NusB